MTTALSEKPRTASRPSRGAGPLSWLRYGDGGLGAIVLVVLVLTILPLYFLIKGSLMTGIPGQPDAKFSLDPVKQVFGTTQYLTALRNSVVSAAAVATLLTAVVGLVCWLLARTDVPGRRFWVFAIPLSIAIGPVVGTMAWIALLSPNGVGLLNKLTNILWGGDILDVYSMGGIILVLAVAFAPFAFLFMYGGFASLASDQEEAARVHGASPMRVFRKISTPSARSTLFGGWALIFTMSIHNLSIYALVGNHALIKTIPGEMYSIVIGANGESGVANVLTLFIIIPSIIVLASHVRYTRRLGAQRILGRQTGQIGVRLGRWRYVGVGFIGVFFLVFVVLPIGAVVLSSFLKYQTADLSRDLFTLDNYRTVRDTPLITDSFWSTLKISLGAATVGVAVAFVLAYVSTRRTGLTSRLAGLVPILLITVPGFALGLGFLWASFTSATLRDFIGTVPGLTAVLIIAYTGFGTRVLSAAFNQFGQAYDEAGRIAGKSTWTRLFRVVAPVMVPALLSVWRLLAVIAILEVNIIILLYSANTVPLAVYLFQALHVSAGSSVYALGVLQMLFVVLIFAVGALPGLRMRKYTHAKVS